MVVCNKIYIMSIIGINGKIGSGKDTIGEIIQYLLCKKLALKMGIPIQDIHSFETYDKKTLSVHSKFEIKKFAGKLKQIASILTGISIEMFEDQEFKKTLMGSQWDYKLDIFEGKEPFMKYIKTESEPMIVREFLQKLGTEAMRDGLHTNVWVNALFADYKLLVYSDRGGWEYPNWIITDMRFPNEMDAVKERKGITIRVIRTTFRTTETEFGKISTIVQPEVDKLLGIPEHPSETALDDAKFDYEIINEGTMEELVKKVRDILVKEELI